MFKHRARELMQEHQLTYSKFSRASGVGMQTAKQLWEDPYYQMGIDTLYKCSKFFGVPITELLVEDDESQVA